MSKVNIKQFKLQPVKSAKAP